MNFARVNIRLRPCGWRFLGIIFVSSILFFNFRLAIDIEIDSLVIGKNYGFLGLFVDTIVSRFCSSVFSFGVLSCS